MAIGVLTIERLFMSVYSLLRMAITKRFLTNHPPGMRTKATQRTNPPRRHAMNAPIKNHTLPPRYGKVSHWHRLTIPRWS